MSKGLTYKKSGVNISEANKFIKDIGPMIKRTYRPEVLTDLGSFGACFKLNSKKYKSPVLVSSADGVGTKIKIAMLANKHDTLGIDLVAMNVNDILAMGAEPLFFLDYVSTGKLKRKQMVSIVKGIAKGCEISGCALIGGETAEMPGIYNDDEYDLAGFCVGIIDRKQVIDGKKISFKDKLIGIESNGLHSNGFSLVRKVFSPAKLKALANELLRPTRIYVKPVLSVKNKFNIKGVAHITGGAFYEKLTRIFPKGKSIVVDKTSWPVPKIFDMIQKQGKIDDQEMYRTFNMGIGMVLVVKKADVAGVQKQLEKSKLKSWVIGEVVKKKQKITFV
ncbi:MAG: phosphoribosylformylglycinamidine cyclo-ligase [PVC group bacterium]|nr:phosphoribosylformylglycinamidine cyclo-ligase [PVC group bacterium]